MQLHRILLREAVDDGGDFDRDRFRKGVLTLDRPKRPGSGYFYFCAEQYRLAKERNMTGGVRQLSASISAQWRALSDADRKVRL